MRSVERRRGDPGSNQRGHGKSELP
jgi:hypothetical protein